MIWQLEGFHCGQVPTKPIPCACGCPRTLLPKSKNEKFATLGCQQRYRKLRNVRNAAIRAAKKRRPV